jgi:hypothetical protein
MALVKHSGPYPLSLEDWFNPWYRPIFETRRSKVSGGLLNVVFYPLGVDAMFHIFLSTSKDIAVPTFARAAGFIVVHTGDI